MESKRKKQLRLAAKWGMYTLLLMLFAALQTMPGFLTVNGVKPSFLLDFCLAVALFEDEYASSLFGALGGLVWDYTAGRTVGLLAVCLLLLCFGVSFLVRSYLQTTLRNYVLMCGGAALLTLSADHLFFYVMRNYVAAGHRYMWTVLPGAVVTALISPVCFAAARFVRRRWGEG